MTHHAMDSPRKHLTARLPFQGLVTAVALTVSLFFWLGWHVYNTYHVGQDVQRIFIRSEALRDTVLDLALEIFATARIAAITGDSQWEQRHRTLTEQLDAAIDNALRLIGKEEFNRYLSHAREIRLRLNKIENRVFEQIHRGTPPGESSELFDEPYEKLQAAFIQAMQDFISAVRDRLASRLRTEKNREIGSLIIAFVIFTLCISIWLWLLRKLQQRGNALSNEIKGHALAKAKLEESEEKYRHLFEYANDAILILDPQTLHFVDANEKATKSLGYNHKELLCLTLRDINRDLAHHGEPKLFDISQTNGGTVFQNTLRRKDGTSFPAEISSRLVEYGNTRVYQCFIRDITEQNQLQEELLQSQKMQALGQLAGGIAHDFSNLLAVIAGDINLAKRLLANYGPATTSLDKADQAIEQANNVVKGLLAFSRKKLPEKHPIKLCELVQNTTRLFRHMLPAKIEITLDKSPATECWVNADSTQLQQVLLNLLLNARDAMPNGGHLHLALFNRSMPPEIHLQVSDTGVGMTLEVQKHIFEPFFTTKTRGYGTGLGLATVHGIVTQYGGRLEVHSKPGQGSIFTVILPMLQPSNVETEETSISGHGERVLLADQQPYIRELMATALGSAGFRVVQISDSSSLLESFWQQRNRIHLLIVNSDLPGPDVLARLSEIQANSTRTLPMILLTDQAATEAVAELNDIMVLRKPFPMRELIRLAARMTIRFTDELDPKR